MSIYIYSDDIFQSFQDPGEPFQTYQKPAPADYKAANAWMARPDLSIDPYEHEGLADVFVIVPTVYKGGEHWNLPVDDTRRIEKLSRITRPNYVDTFSDVGRLFAPYYRQASIYSFLTAREDARRAQDLAYRDIKRSFEFFLENNSPERPIVIVGYNQGALHGTRLLMDYFQGPLAEKLAGAYLLGHPVPLDLFEAELKLTPPCENETDIGCVVSFGAFYPKDEELAERFTSKLLVRNSEGYKSAYNRDLLCTNPLLWNRSEDYAPSRLHKGGVAAQGLEPNTRPALLTKQAGVQCQSGILLVDKPQNSLFRRPLKFGGKFRTLPSNLFYEDLRVNGLKRMTATIDAGHLPKRVQKLDNLDVIDIIESPVTPVKNGN
ncbi:MAG: DUF3089 domain-containing protein [Maricaulaceae bacterium]